MERYPAASATSERQKKKAQDILHIYWNSLKNKQTTTTTKKPLTKLNAGRMQTCHRLLVGLQEAQPLWKSVW
jgi:hypothetical protein